jgi:hypothetical protein
MPQPDISDRPTLTLVEDGDHEPFQLTRGDWRGLWKRFDLISQAQQDLGEQMGTVRSSVHSVKGDMSKVLVSTTAIGEQLAAAAIRIEPAAPAAIEPAPKRSPVLVNITLVTLLLCAVVLTGRQMGWW